MPNRHTIFRGVEEVVEEILMPDSTMLGRKTPQPHSKDIHMQKANLGPIPKRDVQPAPALSFRRIPQTSLRSDSNVFSRGVFGRFFCGWGCEFGGDCVGAFVVTGAEEVFGAAVGYVGFCCCFESGV